MILASRVLGKSRKINLKKTLVADSARHSILVKPDAVPDI